MQAEAEWKGVIAQQPTMTEAYIGLASHYSARGQYEQARKQFMAAEEQDIASLRFYHAWSQAEEQVHHLDEAERLAEKAVAFDPSYPGLKILKAKLARRRKVVQHNPAKAEHCALLNRDQSGVVFRCAPSQAPHLTDHR